MKDNEWDAMTPRGRDRMVARVIFGWDVPDDIAVPYYTTDISSAWQVAEKLRLRVEPYLSMQWMAGVDGRYYWTGQTAALAICRAGVEIAGRGDTATDTATAGAASDDAAGDRQKDTAP